MADALNQVAQETITVTGSPTVLTMPPVPHPTTGGDQILDGVVWRYTPRKAILRNTGAQPVRWAAGPPPTEVTPISGALLAAGETERFMDSGQDYYGVLSRMTLVRDADATADAEVEITFFG